MLHGLVGMAGGVIESTSGIDPVDPVLSAWAAWLASAGTGIREWRVFIVWATDPRGGRSPDRPGDQFRDAMSVDTLRPVRARCNAESSPDPVAETASSSASE